MKKAKMSTGAGKKEMPAGMKPFEKKDDKSKMKMSYGAKGAMKKGK